MDEAFRKAELQREFVGGFVVGALLAAGALDEADAAVDVRGDVMPLEQCGRPMLELAHGLRWGRYGRCGAEGGGG